MNAQCAATLAAWVIIDHAFACCSDQVYAAIDRAGDACKEQYNFLKCMAYRHCRRMSQIASQSWP